MNQNGKPTSPVLDLLGSAKRLTGDVWQLVELQGQLFKLDLQRSTKLTALPLVLLIVGALTTVSALPLVLWAVADGVSGYMNWPLWQSMLLVGGSVLTLGALLIGLSIVQLLRLKSGFSRSFEELNSNLLWIKKLFSE